MEVDDGSFRNKSIKIVSGLMETQLVGENEGDIRLS